MGCEMGVAQRYLDIVNRFGRVGIGCGFGICCPGFYRLSPHFVERYTFQRPDANNADALEGVGYGRYASAVQQRLMRGINPDEKRATTYPLSLSIILTFFADRAALLDSVSLIKSR